jgi:spore coat polysaccharide biosynthesis protein SpsF (cytidylyltransferase family)
VLGRFSSAAHAFDLDPVIRATADNPAVDIESPGRVIAALRATGADYIREEGLPLGAAVEGMTASALHRAAQLATDLYDREHVTPFIRTRRDLFHVLEVQAPSTLTRPELRLTIDTPEDLAWVRELFLRTGSDDPSLATLIAASGRHKTGPAAAFAPRASAPREAGLHEAPLGGTDPADAGLYEVA